MVASKPSGSFKFKKNSTIGAAAAENDHHFLEKCYIDTGDLAVLTDTTSHRQIVVGRTGSGKTALLTRLKETQPNVIELSPFNLSFEYISSSQVIRFFTEAGVNMDPFFKLLWRHVFTVELIKKLHKITDNMSQSVFLSLSMRTWPEEKKEQYRFVMEHGDSFWKETEERVKETTKKTETELKAALKDILGSGLDLEGTKKWTEEQKAEIRALGQEVVSRVKIRDLNRMFDLIRHELNEDAGFSYFLVIDDLDQDWVDDSIRYRLIHALIETVSDFQKVRHVKIVLCLRTDLIQRVMRQIRGSGYQEEKVRSVFLDLEWTEKQLTELLDARINQLVKDSYTLAHVSHKDFLPSMGKKETALEYMLDRTLMRPRDLISFFNWCIQKAVDKPNITKAMLLEAEGEYSKERRTSLEQEWRADYPDLPDFLDLFKKMPPHFRLGNIDDERLTEFILRYVSKHTKPEGPLSHLAYHFYNDIIKGPTFRASIASVMYSIGFLGIKAESYTKMQYITPSSGGMAPDEIGDESLCSVHKMYWRSLGIHPKAGEQR